MNRYEFLIVSKNKKSAIFVFEIEFHNKRSDLYRKYDIKLYN